MGRRRGAETMGKNERIEKKETGVRETIIKSLKKSGFDNFSKGKKGTRYSEGASGRQD